MKKEKLFTEFPPSTTEQWEETINEDLKGASYEKRLIWNTIEGLKIKPYYRAEDLKDKQHLDTLPGEFPYVRGNKKSSAGWEIRQDIPVDDIYAANQKALFVLGRGVSSIGFIINPEANNSAINSQKDFSQLTKDIPLNLVPLNFISNKHSALIIKHLVGEVEEKKLKKDEIFGSVDFDPIGHLTTTGNYYSDENSDFHSLKELLQFTARHLPNFKVIGIKGYCFNNAGASTVQELGYSLAMAVEYLSKMTDAGLDIDLVCQHLQFNFGVGSNYFMEIAKIRAARFLWAKIADTYFTKKEKSKQAYIHSVTSKWNQTIYDPYVNVLRATTEAMAAVIGGTDSLAVRPFTDAFKPATDFSDRIARNIQIVIGEEAYLGDVVDPSAGSYYIENLTESIITEAWKLFLEVEEQGGYLEALKKDFIQSDISKTAQNRLNSVAAGKEVLLGTNQYPNNHELQKNEISLAIAFPEFKEGNFIVTPLYESRASIDLEQIRLATENRSGGRPRVFLLTLGNQIMRRARATFSGNFFACGGYEIIDNSGFDTPENGVASALKSKAEIVVVCSSDDEYASLVPSVKNLIRDKAILVVAGAPSCMETLQLQGIENFIHMRSNIVESLKKYHMQLDIKI